jgi:hypothetical protein
MHEFEFEVRISDQIQTVKMAVGRHLKFYSNIASFRVTKIPQRGKNNCARMRSLKSELAKLTPSIARQVRVAHAPSSHMYPGVRPGARYRPPPIRGGNTDEEPLVNPTKHARSDGALRIYVS